MAKSKVTITTVKSKIRTKSNTKSTSRSKGTKRCPSCGRYM